MMKEYKVYAHINRENGKAYIGITCRDPYIRWGKNGHGYKDQLKFYNAIQKYGWDRFEHLILLDNLDEEEALELESYYIKKYNSIDNGYNILANGIKSYPRCKKVYCLTTHILYPSIKQAAEENDTTATRIIESCQGKNSGTKGLRWAYWNEKNNTYVESIPFVRKHRNEVEIYCIELNKYYPSIIETEKQLSLTPGSVSKAINGNRNGAGGYHFVRASELEKIPEIMKKRTGKNRKVYCVEAKKFFDSLQSAAKFIDKTPQSVMKNCQGKLQSCGGYHFQYQEDVDYLAIIKQLQGEETDDD